ALLSYYVTDRLSFGIGGRYWGVWTTDGQFKFAEVGSPAGPARFYRAAFEQAGGFVQTAYLFGGGEKGTTHVYLKAAAPGARATIGADSMRALSAEVIGVAASTSPTAAAAISTTPPT